MQLLCFQKVVVGMVLANGSGDTVAALKKLHRGGGAVGTGITHVCCLFGYTVDMSFPTCPCLSAKSG